MAIQFSTQSGGKRYEVRTAGRSIRLYTNNAFHSQHHPDHIFTGAVWDLLSLPILFAANPSKTVLMLGVGGGTAIHQIHRLCQPESMIGVELDAMHIQIARQYFNLDYPTLALINDDALHYLKTTRNQFDVLIDDIFLDAIDDPERPVNMNERWLNQLDRHIGRNGVLIQNHLEAQHARDLVRTYGSRLKQSYKSVLLFETEQYENGILACYRNAVRLTEAKQNLENTLPMKELKRLRFDVQQLY